MRITRITAIVTLVGQTPREFQYEASGPVDEEEVALSAIEACGREAVDACAKPFAFQRRDGVLVSGGASVRLVTSEAETDGSPDLTDRELDSLVTARNTDEWDAVCMRVKAVRGDRYPDDWYVKVIASGLATDRSLRWSRDDRERTTPGE
jgi:hypothetical protein